MTFDEFRASLDRESAPDNLSPALTALWLDAKGDWKAAHEAVQDASGEDAAWVHAYLHRKEGDVDNARYWYNRAEREVFEGALKREWEHIASVLLE